MKKGEVYSIDERDLDEADGKHVIIEWDKTPVDPLHDWDQVFYFHSNIGGRLGGNEGDKDYPGLPLVGIKDKDGFPTGEYEFREDVVAFQVSAYIHSGVALSLGDGSHFPDRQWDVTSKAGCMWTDKERWEKMCRKWMHVYDEKAKTDRPAKDMKEFKEYCRTIAEGELETLQKCIDGEVFGYRTEVAVPYKKVYRDGEEEKCVDWDDGGDSCWGYVVDSVNDIDFPNGEGWKVFDATGALCRRQVRHPRVCGDVHQGGRRQAGISPQVC